MKRGLPTYTRRPPRIPPPLPLLRGVKPPHCAPPPSPRRHLRFQKLALRSHAPRLLPKDCGQKTREKTSITPSLPKSIGTGGIGPDKIIGSLQCRASFVRRSLCTLGPTANDGPKPAQGTEQKCRAPRFGHRSHRRHREPRGVAHKTIRFVCAI